LVAALPLYEISGLVLHFFAALSITSSRQRTELSKTCLDEPSSAR